MKHPSKYRVCFRDLAGRTFGRLTVLSETDKRTNHGTVIWNCQCSCGNRKEVSSGLLLTGHTQSCGCLAKDNHPIKHGFSVRKNGSPHKLYGVWCGMIQRCTNPNHPAWDYYGGKTPPVLVCERWRVFENFLHDMGGAYRVGLTIHRKDGNLGYNPENCVWADWFTQIRESSRPVWVTLNGKTNMVRYWAKELGIPEARVYSRIHAGWTPEDALTKPKWTRTSSLSH